MNNTNRVTNRLLLFVVGLVLLALGGVAVSLAAVPAIASGWNDIGQRVQASVSGVLVATPLAQTGHSWLWIALVAVLALIVVVLLVFILRQGHGHTGSLTSGRATGTAPGRLVVESAVAEQALAEALAQRPEFVSTHVSTYRVKKQPVLKISATARRGVSPGDVTEIIEQFVRSWDALLGSEIPVLVHISGGFRTRLSKSTRLQ